MFFYLVGLLPNDPSNTPNSTAVLLLVAFSCATICPLMPRFIISVRELYDRDLHRRRQGIDTGFGVLSLAIASENAAVSAIAFADVTPGENQTVEGDANELEAIRLEPLGDNTGHV